MRFPLVVTLLISCSMAQAQEWHPVNSSFCSEIKAKGARVSYRPFSIFAAPAADTRCCEGLSLKVKGKTQDFGHFRVLDLELGRYFLSFDLKTKRVNVPLLVDRIVDKSYIGRDCEPLSKITVDKSTNALTWEEWVIVE